MFGMVIVCRGTSSEDRTIEEEEEDTMINSNKQHAFSPDDGKQMSTALGDKNAFIFKIPYGGKVSSYIGKMFLLLQNPCPCVNSIKQLLIITQCCA